MTEREKEMQDQEKVGKPSETDSIKFQIKCRHKIPLKLTQLSPRSGGGRVVRWSWVNFQCRGVLLVWIRVEQGPTALAVGAGGGCLDIFTLIYPFSSLSPSLWETTRYRLKYCLKGSLSQKTTNQPTKSQISSKISSGKKDSTEIRHQRHHQRQPGEQLFPIEVTTG